MLSNSPTAESIPNTSESLVALASRHHSSRLVIYSEADFRRDSNIHVRIGLCAGLVSVWCSEQRYGRDGIKCIQEVTPSLVQRVLLGQAVSFYLKSLPANDQILTPAESALLNVKYGAGGVCSARNLLEMMPARDLLELDLMLQHRMPVVRTWELLSHSVRDVVNAISSDFTPGLYMFVLRYWHARRGGERGHRITVLIEEKRCKFYDPGIGELQFGCLDDLCAWLYDYWIIARWDRLLRRRNSPVSPPIRIFLLRGKLTQDAEDAAIRYDARCYNDALMSADIGECLLNDRES